MQKRILPKAMLVPLSIFGLMLSANDVRATDYPCPTKLAGPQACDVYLNQADTTWMTIDIALKKPEGDLTTPENKALLTQYTNRLYYGYSWLRAKGHPDDPLSPPAEADQKWEYTGFIVSKPHMYTLELDDIVATMTYKPDGIASVRWNRIVDGSGDMAKEVFALDGKCISGRGAKARQTEIQRPSGLTTISR